MVGTLAFRDTVGYRYFDDHYWTTEFLDVTPPSRVNRGFLYFKHHGRPWVNQAELAGRVKFGVEHDVLIGWDYQLYDNYTHRRGAANFNTTPLDLYNPVETHVSVDVLSFPITRIDYSTQRTHGVFVQDALALTSRLKVVAGVRVDRLRRSAHNNPITNGTETDGPVTRGRSGDVTYRAGVVYQPTGAFDLYAQNSTSFKPNFSVQPDGTLLEPEYGELLEVGQRVRMMQERLELSSAVYGDPEAERRTLDRWWPLRSDWQGQVSRFRSRSAWPAGLVVERRTGLRVHQGEAGRLSDECRCRSLRQRTAPSAGAHAQRLDDVRMAERPFADRRGPARRGAVHQRQQRRSVQCLRAAQPGRRLHPGPRAVRTESDQRHRRSVLDVVARQSPAVSRPAVQRDWDRARSNELRPRCSGNKSLRIQMRFMKSISVALLLIVGVVSDALAHYTYVIPQSFRVSAGDTVVVGFHSGDGFPESSAVLKRLQDPTIHTERGTLKVDGLMEDGRQAPGRIRQCRRAWPRDRDGRERGRDGGDEPRVIRGVLEEGSGAYRPGAGPAR